MKKSWCKELLLGGALMILTAQIYVEVFQSDLVISVAAVLFSVYAMVWGKYPVMGLAVIAAAGNFLMRIGIHYLRYETWNAGIYWHEMVFYLVYGALFWLLMHPIHWEVRHPGQLLLIVVVDYLANLAELMCRGTGEKSLRMHTALLMVAVVRTLIVLGVWSILHHQSLLLLRREHRQRYSHLMLLISRLRGEMLWMTKSAAMMEETMGNAYRLYSCLAEEEHPAARQALNVSKDVHELKKEYQMIVRGLSEVMEQDLERSSVSFQELWQILHQQMHAAARRSGVEVQWQVDLPFDFQTDKQYQLLSILRNLVDNAIEAAVDGQTVIRLSLRRQEGEILLSVTNRGKTIPQRSLEHIFDPGYSTKIDYTTGKVGRGVGLSLVRDLTEQELNGRIHVESEEGETCFTLSFPQASLEVSA